MGYKIIVLNLDGTPANRDKIIIPRVKGAPMEAREAGDVVVLASDRPMADMELLTGELELSHFGSYILSYDGGMIANCKTGETVLPSLPPKESSQKTIGLAGEHKADVLTHEDGEIITNNEEYPYAIAESNINHLPSRQVEDTKSYVDFRVPKFLMSDDGDYPTTVEPKVKAATRRDFSAYHSEPYFLEITPKGVDKAQSLAHLLKMLGLGRGQMMACGDGYNNLTMIKYTGLGVVMENTVLPVRQAADYIIVFNSHDGIGVVVEKFILF